MQLVFEAIDEEFAAATGSNVNIVPGEITVLAAWPQPE